ncbi:hypothetical protein AVEN_230029-1 [Araneus ventricosus]|uniref:Uncharacterized protein n=1 Tax=Araneus ventricosus TaxID=182803 RepID=A0A4Y2CTB0_ARAVE|nr:hypothetical protein AVEN_230029-1 [Araneus ventricosus]
MSLPGNSSLMVGKRHLQRFLLTIEGDHPMISSVGDHFGDFGNKTKILKNARIFAIPLIEAEIRLLPEICMWRHALSERLQIRGSMDRLGACLIVLVMIDWDRLWIANAFGISL